MAHLLLAFILLPGLPLAARTAGGEGDPYQIEFVRVCLKMGAGGFRTGFIAKNLLKLGDRVGIALLKAYSSSRLADPQTVRALLPVVREAFSRPELIAVAQDAQPQVTLLLLGDLLAKSDDPELRDRMTETIKFVVRATKDVRDGADAEPE